MKKSTQANNGNNYRSALGRDVPLFSVGRTVAAPGASTLLDHAGVNASALLARHQRGDFSDIDEADRFVKANALRHHARMLSAYVLGHGIRILIVTEADRSLTTLLLPEKY